MQVATGSYTGNGTSQSISGFGFAPALVLLFCPKFSGGSGNCDLLWTSTAFAANNTYSVSGNDIASGLITSLDSDGFSVGSGARTNFSGNVFHYIGCKADATMLSVGTYSGNGADNRNITIADSFQPNVVFVHRGDAAGNEGQYWHSSKGGDNTWRLTFNATVNANRIQGVHATGFQVGSDAQINASGKTYYYICLKNATGNVFAGTYSGDSTDNRNIAQGDAFQPNMTFIQSESASALFPATKPSALAGDAAYALALTSGTAANYIQGFTATGFQVGNAPTVNTVGNTYYYFSLINSTPAPPFDPSTGFPYISYPMHIPFTEWM